MPRPSLTADTMVLKLSSLRTISDAFLATSVPVWPIAQPISAAFNAGASLTPSPVIATTLSLLWNAFTIRTLCSGDTLANTRYSSTCLQNSSLESLESSAPEIAFSFSPRIPICFAMAHAVLMWSPVIMTGMIPAPLQVLTAGMTSFLGGSIIPMRPKKTSSCSREFSVRLLGFREMSL